MGALIIDASVQEKILLMLSKDSTINNLVDMFKERQEEYKRQIDNLKSKLSKQPSIEWISVSNVAKAKCLTSDAVRKQLQNGEFEEGVDFKYNGSRILINQGAVEQIQRKRRSSNG